MINQLPEESWEMWQLEKRNQEHLYGEARIIIKIAQWRATEIMKQQAFEDLKMDAYIDLRDLLSSLKVENGLKFDPRDERETIDHYRYPRPLSQKFRSRTLDLLLLVEVWRSEYENEVYQKFKHTLFPYLPPYDINP